MSVASFIDLFVQEEHGSWLQALCFPCFFFFISFHSCFILERMCFRSLFSLSFQFSDALGVVRFEELLTLINWMYLVDNGNCINVIYSDFPFL